jgi:hypothetical protein
MSSYWPKTCAQAYIREIEAYERGILFIKQWKQKFPDDEEIQARTDELISLEDFIKMFKDICNLDERGADNFTIEDVQKYLVIS